MANVVIWLVIVVIFKTITKLTLDWLSHFHLESNSLFVTFLKKKDFWHLVNKNHLYIFVLNVYVQPIFLSGILFQLFSWKTLHIKFQLWVVCNLSTIKMYQKWVQKKLFEHQHPLKKCFIFHEENASSGINAYSLMFRNVIDWHLLIDFIRSAFLNILHSSHSWLAWQAMETSDIWLSLIIRWLHWCLIHMMCYRLHSYDQCLLQFYQIISTFLSVLIRMVNISDWPFYIDANHILSGNFGRKRICHVDIQGYVESIRFYL